LALSFLAFALACDAGGGGGAETGGGTGANQPSDGGVAGPDGELSDATAADAPTVDATPGDEASPDTADPGQADPDATTVDNPSPDAEAGAPADTGADAPADAEADVEAGAPADAGADAPADAPAGDACTPACEDRICGEDGCGGVCGDCPSGQSCTEEGSCEDKVYDCAVAMATRFDTCGHDDPELSQAEVVTLCEDTLDALWRCRLDCYTYDFVDCMQARICEIGCAKSNTYTCDCQCWCKDIVNCMIPGRVNGDGTGPEPPSCWDLCRENNICSRCNGIQQARGSCTMNSAEAKYGCIGYNACSGSCDGNQSCAQDCAKSASSEGIYWLQALSDCAQSAGCAGDNTCEEACPDEWLGCFGPPGEASCSEILACVEAPDCGSRWCNTECFAAGDEEAQNLYNTLAECAGAAQCTSLEACQGPCGQEIAACQAESPVICTTDSECKPGEYCSEDVGECARGCGDDSECPDGKICSALRCQPACDDETRPCPEDFICEEGRCKVEGGCLVPQDCLIPETYCDEETWTCQPGCLSDFDCKSSTTACVDGECVDKPCLGNFSCAYRQVCDRSTGKCAQAEGPYCDVCNPEGGQAGHDAQCGDGGMCMTVQDEEGNERGSFCLPACLSGHPDRCPKGFQCIEIGGHNGNLVTEVCGRDCSADPVDSNEEQPPE
jgi:hypothetical protein